MALAEPELRSTNGHCGDSGHARRTSEQAAHIDRDASRQPTAGLPFDDSHTNGSSSTHGAPPTAVLVPTPAELAALYPLSDEAARRIADVRVAVRRVLRGVDRRLLVVVGPCSIHDTAAACEYAVHFERWQRAFGGALLLVMRVYCEKPRTRLGWRGLLRDPALDGSDDLVAGLHATRGLLVALAARSIPCGVEFLDPFAAPFLVDAVSWASIGARTCESQVHRDLASGLPCPVAFKNATSGSVATAVDGIVAARHPRAVFAVGASGRVEAVRTKGNSDGHLVLRGGGASGPNYGAAAVRHALECLAAVATPSHIFANQNGVSGSNGNNKCCCGPRGFLGSLGGSVAPPPSPPASPSATATPDSPMVAVVVDCSHGNCGKDFRRQAAVARDVAERYASGEAGIGGIMLESNLVEGSQELPGVPGTPLPSPITRAPDAAVANGEHGTRACDRLAYGVSITDGCLGLPETERILAELAQAVMRRRQFLAA